MVAGAEGDVILAASLDTPFDLLGRNCVIAGTSRNQDSVHPGNNLIIVSGDITITIPDFEDSLFSEHEISLEPDAAQLEGLGDTIDFFIELGPDGISSGGLVVSIDCPDLVDPEVTPTTETPPTTEMPTTVPATTAPPATDAPEPKAAPDLVTSPTILEPSDSATSTTGAAGPTIVGAPVRSTRLARFAGDRNQSASFRAGWILPPRGGHRAS